MQTTSTEPEPIPQLDWPTETGKERAANVLAYIAELPIGAEHDVLTIRLSDRRRDFRWDTEATFEVTCTSKCAHAWSFHAPKEATTVLDRGVNRARDTAEMLAVWLGTRLDRHVVRNPAPGSTAPIWCAWALPNTTESA